jgi:hypothetical protein
VPHHHGTEANIIATELSGFDYQHSPVWVSIRQQFSSGVRQKELVSIATVLCSLVETIPLLTRSEKRSYPLLVRWFEQNWAEIEPFFALIHLHDEEMEPINFERERHETIIRHRMALWK